MLPTDCKHSNSPTYILLTRSLITQKPPLGSLSLEPGLDSTHTPLAPTILTNNKPHSVLLRQQCVRTLTSLACNILMNIASHDVLQLFLLEPTFENETV